MLKKTGIIGFIVYCFLYLYLIVISFKNIKRKTDFNIKVSSVYIFSFIVLFLVFQITAEVYGAIQITTVLIMFIAYFLVQKKGLMYKIIDLNNFISFKTVNLVKNMGIKYLLFRVLYSLKTKFGILKKQFPTNP